MTFIKWIDRNLITSPYSVGLCQTEKSFIKELKRLKVPANEIPVWVDADKDACVHFVTENGGRNKCYIICVRENKDTTANEVIGLLIHESVHVWQEIKKDINETDPSSEFEAYSIQQIAQNLIQEYKYKKKK